jgi:hypothetical protein
VRRGEREDRHQDARTASGKKRGCFFHDREIPFCVLMKIHKNKALSGLEFDKYDY